MAFITGRLNSTGNYRTLPIVHTSTKVGTLGVDTDSIITAYTGVQTMGLTPLWYNIKLDNGNFWIHSSLVSTTESLLGIPFVDARELLNPQNLPFEPVNKVITLLSGMNITIKAGEVLDEMLVGRVHVLFRKYGTHLNGEWTNDTLREAMDIVEDLSQYTVMLHAAGGRGWTLEEMRLVYEAIRLTAVRSFHHFGLIFSANELDDKFIPFRLLYGPLHIIRDGRDNLHPKPDPVTNKPIWWAQNLQGFEVYLGNMVFTGKSAKFKPIHLVIHEIAHCINWRYTIDGASPASLYKNIGSYTIPAAESASGIEEQVHFGTIDEGYIPNVRPRSGDEPHEVVTDAFTNDIIGSYADSPEGTGRAVQVRNLMNDVIRHRIKSYDAAREHIKDKLEAQMSVALQLLEENEQSALEKFRQQL